MNKTEFRNMLHSLSDAWKKQDYKSAASMFAEDVHYADPLRYSFQNRDELLVFFEADDGRPQITVWHTIIFDVGQQVGMAEYTYEGTYRYHGVALVRVIDGKISHWREYQHIDTRDWIEYVSGTKF